MQCWDPALCEWGLRSVFDALRLSIGVRGLLGKSHLRLPSEEQHQLVAESRVRWVAEWMESRPLRELEPIRRGGLPWLRLGLVPVRSNIRYDTVYFYRCRTEPTVLFRFKIYRRIHLLYGIL